jgi:hypothetical protein
MQVVFRSLLVVTIATWTACSLNDHGLNGDAGRTGNDSGAVSPQGVAGGGGSTTSSSPGTAGTMAPTTGAAGTGAVPTGGATGGGAPDPMGAGGGAGNGTAGTGPDPTSGGAGNPAGGGVGGATGGGAGGATAGGAGGSSASGATGTTTGAGGVMGEQGCADGTREGFVDRVKYPRIAACAGGWETPGLSSSDSLSPQCERRAGNDGDRSDGRGCSVTDLCALGWHVCDSARSLAGIVTGCDDAIAPSGVNHVYFLTRQRGTGLDCDANNQTGTNNVYGCGNIGSTADKTCAPFTHMLRDSDCQAEAPWQCAHGPIGTSQDEYEVVTKTGPSRGGVLCCHN